MKIILMILLSMCLSLSNCDYPRFKRKGMVQNGPYRPPPPPQFGKKWGKPPQKMPPQFGQKRPYQGGPPPTRGNRPPKPQMHTMQGFNMYKAQQHHLMPSVTKFQQFPQQQKGPPTTMKDYFKMPFQQNPKPHVIPGQLIQFPQENKIIPNIIPKQEAPSFVSSPSIPAALEYDYHIQSNSIPMSVNTIKQVGEKGPIHTIPAPNLTPADKPSNLELRKPLQYHQQQEVRYQPPPQYLNEQPQQLYHQYQVTEHSEQIPQQQFREQINSQSHHTPTQEYHVNNQQSDQYGIQNVDHQNNVQAYQTFNYGHSNLGVTMQETPNHGINIGFAQPQSDESEEDMMLSNSKHYQVVNTHFSTGPPNQNLHTQAIQSSYEQQQPQILTQFIQPESDYLQHYKQENVQIAEDKTLNVKPEYHSFNYDEQAHQAQAKSGQSSGLVTATYSLGTAEEVVNGQHKNSRSSSVDPLLQAQIIQSYFGSRSANDVEPDAKPSGSGNIEKDVATSFYSSLPNKEAAERLAKLQAAGKINRNLMQIGNVNQNQREEDNTSGENEDATSKEQSVEYEDYSQEDESSQSDENTGFGQKTKY